MIGKVIHSLLKDDTTVSGLVGIKIHPLIVPQNAAFPAITYEIISTEYLEVKGLQKVADKVNIQVNIFSKVYGASIAQAVKAVLDYKHRFQSEGLDIDYIVPTGEHDGVFDQQLQIYHRVLTYEVSIHQPYTL